MEKERVVRRLAAILAADVVGYSRLIRADEEGTLARFKALRQDVIDPSVARHNGRIFKLMGDGMLVEYQSVVDAVRNAVEVQREVAARQAELPDDRRIEFRIGINLGDVVIDGDDIHGGGVNIAARLEGLADPGGICVSGNVYDEVRDRIDLPFEDLGKREVKNIDRPVRVWRWATGATAKPEATPEVAEPPAVPDRPSIVVLPFVNMSGDPEQEYFSDGITEDIITELSRNRFFFVISRSTSFTFKSKNVDVAQIARELGVRFVLEGSVRKAGNRVRITAQLIEGATDHHVWAERYDRDLEDIFEVQDEITGTIVGSIAPGIVSAEVQRARRKDSQQLDAWDRTMRAHWHIRRFNKEDNTEARRLLLEAVELDPGNASAWSDLAFAGHFDAIFGWSDAPAESFAQFSDAAQKAVAADERDAFAHTARAIDELFSGRHDDAVRRLERAIELDPNLSFARGYLGTTYAFAGEYEPAMKNFDLAIRLSPRDPLMVIWHTAMAWAAYNTERFEEATELAKRAYEDNAEFVDVYSVLAAAHGQLGKAEEASAALDELTRRLPNLTTGDDRLIRPFKRPADQQRFLDGLRKAGLPD